MNDLVLIRTRGVLLGLCLALLAGVSAPLTAAPVALLNASDRTVTVKVRHLGKETSTHRIEVGSTVLLPVGREPVLDIEDGKKGLSLRLDPYHAYLLGVTKDGDLGCQGIELADPMPDPKDVPEQPPEQKLLEIPVKLVGDSKDARAPMAWQKAYGQRLSEASAIWEAHCGVRFVVVDSAEWGPDDATEPQLKSLFTEFQGKVLVKKGQLAVGYTLRVPRQKPRQPDEDEDAPATEWFGRNGLPGTPHILLRDEVPESEGERVEVLAHHLGWYLGAVTSPDENSIMRAKLGDGKAARARHQFRVDPINVLIVGIWIEEFRAGRGESWKTLNPLAATRLKLLYRTLYKLQADELVIGDYIVSLEELSGKSTRPTLPTQPMMPEVSPEVPHIPPTKPTQSAARQQAIKKVVSAIVARAEQLKKENSPIKGDLLTAELIKSAAIAARTCDAWDQVSAFCSGLGIALDDSQVLRGNPLTRALCQAIETDREREARIGVLGSPTMNNRRDLCQHFVVSLALADLVSPAAAELAGLSKELLDMKGVSGFSFADLAADYTGIELARLLTANPALLAEIAKGFDPEIWFPSVKGLREGIAEARFKSDLGSIDDPRFQAEVEKVRTRVLALPGFKLREKN